MHFRCTLTYPFFINQRAIVRNLLRAHARFAAASQDC
jgi:hypothetical protein